MVFIVDTLISIAYPYNGGSIVLHKLANELAKRGHNVYVFNEPYFPHENIRVIPSSLLNDNNEFKNKFIFETFVFNPYKTITITHQSSSINFGTIYNCRWILKDCESYFWDQYDKNDFFYNFGSFKTVDNVEQKPLTIYDYKLDKFFNFNKNRKGFCALLYKNHPKDGDKIIENFEPEFLDLKNNFNNDDYLLQFFNKYEYLLTFDHKTYLTTIAALCGTKVIILKNNDNLTPTQYRLQNPIQFFGVAYGLNDISWANNTIDLVRDNLENLKTEDDKTVNDFVEFWEKKLN